MSKIPIDSGSFLRPLRVLRVFLLPLLAALTPVLAGPLSPAESISTMEVEAGFRVELFAAEPDVVDPVCMTADAGGRVYVCEMREMEALPALEPGTGGTVRLLEDRDGDGRADRSVVFADGLSFPGGIAPSEGGMYVLCTPDLLYLKDTDGDGSADIRRVVLTGFAQGNAEHRFNNLKWGPDNRLYAANGGGGGVVHDPSSPGSRRLDLKNLDYVYDPASGAFDSLSRNIAGGFGLTFDDRGRRYVCHNERHCMMVVLPQRYVGRNADYPVAATSEDISEDPSPDDKVYPISDPQAWRIERTSRRAEHESKRFRTTQLQANGWFTAACGVTVYRADLFPPSHRGSVFVCDAAQNLVHRSLLIENGTSMIARRADEGTEFLRARDPWFRPVNLYVGPDGALWIADFYREIIETGASIPEDILRGLDLRAGADRGRIYRVVPDASAGEGERREAGGAYPESASDGELTAMLEHPNAWWRATAQRLLVERNAESEIGTLRKMSASGRIPQARIHALHTLAGLGAIDEATVLGAIGDADPGVREHAVGLAELIGRKN